MAQLTDESFERPDDLTDRSNPAVLYAISLLVIRAIVGFLGIALPLVLILGEAFFLQGGVGARDSISAYYHTSMRDVFVGSLSVIGFLLATYMSGQTNTKDFWYSLVAGVAVLGVVFFPTTRPGLAEGAARCGATPIPEGCSAVQQQLGEAVAARLHFFFAAVFILCLARICFFFAYREEEHKQAPNLARTLRILGWVIVAAVAWIIVGQLLDFTVVGLTPLYIGEVVAVLAFGIAWLLKARDLRRAFG